MKRRVIATLIAVLTILVVYLPSAAQAQSTSGIGIQSASGCSQWVCITIDGGGLWVNFISTTGQNHNAVAVSAYPKYWRNGLLVKSGTSRVIQCCGKKSGDTWNVGANWKDKDKVCVSWVATPKIIPGYPCKYIYK